ncbi:MULTISPECIES: hypothetical protein [Bacteria]|uniref:hypothetical protein n=1 Tax=Bacteria TaxID=2 RepID=UPI003C7C6929
MPLREDTAFAHLFRHAIETQGVSLSQLRRRLAAQAIPISLATLSYWRSGARRPEGEQSRAVVHALEEILGLDPGALVDALGPSRRPGQSPAPGTVFADEHERWTTETLAAIDADPSERIREISSTTVATVGPDGALKSLRTRSLHQATTGKGVRSLAMVIPVDPDTPSRPRILTVRGADVAFEFTHPSNAMIGARIVLETELRAPETAIVEYGFDLPPDYPPQYAAAHGTLRRTRELAIWVQFDPAAVPAWVQETEENGEGERVHPRHPVQGTTAHAIRRSFGPGWLSIEWG